MEDPVTARIRQLEKKDRAEQVSTKLVEGQVKEEAAELRPRVRNDIKLPKGPHSGRKSSIVNLGGLRDFPHPPESKTEHTDGEMGSDMPWAALDLRGDEQPRAPMCSNNTDSQMEFGLQPTTEDSGYIGRLEYINRFIQAKTLVSVWMY